MAKLETYRQGEQAGYEGYGWLGVALIIIGQTLTYVHWRPLSDYWFGLVWFGYIFAADAFIYRRDGYSLWMNRRRDFLLMLPVSALGWWGFEAANAVVHNWAYIIPPDIPDWWQQTMMTVFFSTVVLAEFETALLLLPLGFFQRRIGAAQFTLTRAKLATVFGLGIIALALPLLFPHYAFPLIWGFVALLLDPLNHKLGRPSILGYVAKGDWRVPIALYVGGTICGLLWEFWNFWAYPKWYYTVPFVNFWHVFEMPLLGYIGYGPFALEIFTLYQFVRGFLPAGWREQGEASEGIKQMGL